jgi:hypothetical protein
LCLQCRFEFIFAPTGHLVLEKKMGMERVDRQ